jgi:hypothetical protein
MRGAPTLKSKHEAPEEHVRRAPGPPLDGSAGAKGDAMPEDVNLTEAEHDQVEADAKDAEMLTEAELETIATRLNNAIDLPIMNEKTEQIVFVKIVKLIDRFLYSVLPNEIYELIRVASDGISEQDAALIEENLAELVNRKIDLPFLSESMEETVFRVVIGTIVRAMIKGKSLESG